MGKTKSRRGARAAQPVPRMTRRETQQRLTKLVDGLKWYVDVAESLIRANKPNDQHIYIEWQLRTAFGVQLEALYRGLEEARSLATLINETGQQAQA